MFTLYSVSARLADLHAPDGMPLPSPQRTTLSEYKTYPDRNPNGLMRPDFVRADAWGTLGECVPFQARVTRQRGVHTLHVKTDAPIEPGLLAAVADALRRAELAARGRAHGRGLGRN